MMPRIKSFSIPKFVAGSSVRPVESVKAHRVSDPVSDSHPRMLPVMRLRFTSDGRGNTGFNFEPVGEFSEGIEAQHIDSVSDEVT